VPGDFFGRTGEYLGTDGMEDGKVYVLNDGKAPNRKNTTIELGGTVAGKSSRGTKAEFNRIGYEQ